MAKKVQKNSVAFLKEIHGITVSRFWMMMGQSDMVKRVVSPVKRRLRTVIGNMKKNSI